MWRYLKAAFWARPEIPGLGRMPLNIVVLAGFGLLGFGHQGFWMAGATLEMAYLFALTTNPRFQKWTDAQHITFEENTVEKQRLALIQALTPARQNQLEALDAKCAQVLQLERDAQAEIDNFTVSSTGDALSKIQWLYLKLLIAQQNLASLQGPSAHDDLTRQITLIESDLRSGKLSSSLHQSKTATLKILQQRLANLGRRERDLEEIHSDLTRIEAQVDLALENAGMRGRTEMISGNLHLVSQLLDPSIYGESSENVQAVEASFRSAQ
ncbi:MAG TPA: hypothetical protein VIT21_10715 [Chthoniobacterales bacterium]